ncbi:MAG: rod shape-determining protein MreD [Kiritimatiellales bacterium]|nr:rod shape-determining protein MreD [Kiritimatiellales bacterium]
MSRVAMFPLMVMGTVVQSLLPVWPLLGSVKPPVLPALVLFYSLKGSPRLMWAAAIWAALLQDGIDAGPIGPALIAFPIIGNLAYRVRNEVFPEQLVTQFIFGALGHMLVTLVFLLVFTATGARPLAFSFGALRMLGAFLSGMVTLPVVFFIMHRFEESLPQRRAVVWQ